MRSSREDQGQASIELLALLPLVAALAALVWQAVVTGQAIWLSGAAARAAARADAVGGDPARAARGALPGVLERRLRVTRERGGVRVAIGVPLVSATGTLLTVEAVAGFPEQR